MIKWINYGGKGVNMKVINSETVSLVKYIKDPYVSIVDGYSFTECTIMGPSVLYLLNDINMNGSNFTGSFDSLIIKIDKPKTIQGVIGLKNCVFEGCYFVNISFMVNEEQYQMFKKGFGIVDNIPVSELRDWDKWWAGIIEKEVSD